MFVCVELTLLFTQTTVDIECAKPQKQIINSDAQKLLDSLMWDWCDPEDDKYHLGSKLTSEIFKKLYEIADRKIYASACLRIIYQYFYENDSINDLKNLCCIDDILSLKNQRFKVELLKVIVVHWKTGTTSDDYKTYKHKILNVVDEESRVFFQLAFLLHEHFVNKFEIDLESFLEKLSRSFGDFYKTVVVENLRLLLVIMKNNQMNRTIDFVFVRCPYIDYNSTILTTLKESQDHKKFVVEPFENEEFEELVSGIASLNLLKLIFKFDAE